MIKMLGTTDIDYNYQRLFGFLNAVLNIKYRNKNSRRDTATRVLYMYKVLAFSINKKRECIMGLKLSNDAKVLSDFFLIWKLFKRKKNV